MTRTKGKHLSDHQWPQFACNQLSHTKPLLSWPWQMPKSSMTHERSLTIMDISHTNCARTIQKRLWFPELSVVSQNVSLAFGELASWCYGARSLWWISDGTGRSEPLQPTRFCPGRRVGPARPTSPAGSCAVEPGVTVASPWRHRVVTVSPYNLYILNWLKLAP